MRYWYDWEFDEDGSTIIPISLGMVSEDGRELYVINEDHMAYWDELDRPLTDPRLVWMDQNVLCHITQEDRDRFGVAYSDMPDIVLNFISDNGKYESSDEIELWGHFAAYDHVCLAQLWGPMINLPDPVPMFTNDDMTIKGDQPWITRDEELFPKHHALYDAKFQRYQWEQWSKTDD